MATKKNASLAVLSLGLGVLGVLFAQTRAGLLLVLAVPMGVVAAYAGYLALRLIQQAPASFRGKGLAIVGACLGGMSTMLSLYVLVAVWPQRQAQHQRWTRDAQGPPAAVQRPGPTVPLEDFQPRPAVRRDFGWRSGPVGFPGSTMPDGPVTNFTSNLPIVVIETGGRMIYKDGQTPVRTKVIDTAGGKSSFQTKADYDGLATIHLRGNSTLRLPKRSYTLHTVDDRTNQVKVSLLGMPKEEDWVLYAPYEDKTMIRDVLAYELSNKMGRYAPRTRYVEMFVNTSGRPVSMRDYVGVYVLIEKIKRGKGRVNIEKLEPQHKSEPDISGGYMIKRDHSEREESGFYTRRGGPYYYVYPKAEDITPEQRAWLVRNLNQFEASLYSAKFNDPQQGYSAYLDADSFIDAHWLVEMSKNVDGFRYSSYLTKDRGGKWKAEPPWDWNRSFGNANYYGGWQVNNWYWTYLRPNEISWFRRLGQDPDFQQKCTDRWFALRKDLFDPRKVTARVDELATQLKEAQKRNYKRWPILGQQITCNYYVGNSFEDEVRWLKNWIERRIAWIDSQLGAPPRLRQSATVLVPGRSVGFQAASGEIYYTLDGTDPRAAGGAVAPAAQRFQADIVPQEGVRLVARIRYNALWSAPLTLQCEGPSSRSADSAAR